MKFHWCHTVKSLLETSIIVKIDVVFYRMNQFISVCKSAEVVHLRLQHSPEALHWTVVDTSSDSGHTLPHFRCLKLFIESIAGVLVSSVTMEQRMCARIERNCFIKIVKHKLVIVAVANCIRYDSFVIQIQNSTQIQLYEFLSQYNI